MIYCDTSLLIAALTVEPGSGAAVDLIAGGEPLGVSDWSRTEVASALAQKQRQRVIAAAERLSVQAMWRALVRRCVLLPIEASDFTRAADLVDAAPCGLRAGDALHLALVVRHGCELATFDKDLADAARALGVVVYP